MSKQTEIIFGLHAVRHALQEHPERVLNLWLQKGRKSSEEVEEIIKLAGEHATRIERVSRQTLDKHCDGTAHQGVMLKRRTAHSSLISNIEDVLSLAKPAPFLFLVLDGIQDPHNLGACLRTADAAGVDAVIIPADNAVSVNATVRKVASGAAEHMPVITVTNLVRALRRLREAGVWIAGADDGAEQSFYDLDLKVPLAVVMGAEGKGMKRLTREHCDYLVSLPMLGTVESLNVAVAAGVCLYEVNRQRRGREQC